MNPLAWDTETGLIRPALLAPPLVCVSWQRPGFNARLDHVSDALPRLRSWLTDPTTLLVGHFVAYDATVICAAFPELVPSVFAAYKAGRITCTKKRQQLLDIAGGVFRGRPGEKGKWITHEYTLEALAKRHLGVQMDKDAWRLEYAHFVDVPISDWPARARQLQNKAFARRDELPTAGALKYALEDLERQHGKAVADGIAAEIKRLDAMLADSPEGCIRYPMADAECTLGVWQQQEKHADYLKDQFRQAYADFVLYLSSTWGLRTHAPGVEALRAELEEAIKEFEADLVDRGLVRADGTRDMRAVKDAMIAACREFGLPIRRTDAHFTPHKDTGLKCVDTLGDACDEHVCLDSDACEAVVLAAQAETVGVVAGQSDAAETFIAYAEFSTLKKMLSNDVPMLEAGITYPVHTRYDMAETGRTTSSKPNIQNLNTGRVKNDKSRAQRLRPGVRQAFIPRPGMVFAQADFPQLELYTLAQWCVSRFGWSKLADTLNAGLDPHLIMAAKIVGCTYEEAERRGKKDHAIYDGRQTGKAFNFGKPGGMGDVKFRVSARKMYQVELSEEQCKTYTAQWYETFPEMRLHFDWVRQMFPDETVKRCTVETLHTERRRGGATYCAACNNGFQALGADCAKRAMCLVAESEYCDTGSPLYGSRTVAFVHDEIIVETPDTPNAHDAAFELAALMCLGANYYLPNVPIPLSKMEPTLMRQWDKNAKQVFVDGRLVPWSAS